MRKKNIAQDPSLGKMYRGAEFSACGTFRYLLVRMWNPDKPALVYIMLNPSTAGKELDDPTIRKCVGFARRLGYGGIAVVNLFAYRTSSPAILAENGYQVGPDNDSFIRRALAPFKNPGQGKCIVAWGAQARRLRGEAVQRPGQVIRMLKELGVQPYSLAVTGDGIPRHPLMLPYSSVLAAYEHPASEV